MAIPVGQRPQVHFPQAHAKPVRSSEDRIFTVQNLKSTGSVVGIAAGAKVFADLSLNISRYAGGLGVMIPEAIMQIPVGSYLKGELSESSCLLIDSVRVHALALLRIGICVTGALSLFSLLKSRNEMNTLFFVMGAAYYSGITIDYGIKTADSLRDIHRSNAYCQKTDDYYSSSIVDYLGILKKPDGSVDIDAVYETMGAMSKMDDTLLAAGSKSLEYYYHTFLPSTLTTLESVCPKEHVSGALSKLSFGSYIAAMGHKSDYWRMGAPHLRDAKLPKDQIEDIKAKITAYRPSDDKEGADYLDLKNSLLDLIDDCQKKSGVRAYQYYYGLYAKFRNLDYPTIDNDFQSQFIDVPTLLQAFTHLFGDLDKEQLEQMDEVVRAYFKEDLDKSINEMLELLQRVNEQVPEALKGGEHAESSAHPGHRKEIMEASGQYQYQVEAVKEALKGRFGQSESLEKLFEGNPQKLIASLLLGRSNEEVRDFTIPQTDTVSEELVDAYKSEIKIHLKKLLESHRINTLNKLELYADAQWARFEAFSEVFSTALPKNKTVESLILTQKKWNMLAVLNKVFEQAPFTYTIDVQDINVYKRKLVEYLNELKEKEKLNERGYASWLQFINDNNLFNDGEFHTYSNLPSITYTYQSRDSIATLLANRFKARTIKILKKAKDLFVPALEITGVLAALSDPRRSIMATVLLVGALHGSSPRNPLHQSQNIGERWQFSYIGQLKDVRPTDLRSISRKTWYFAQTMIYPSIWSAPFGIFPSTYALGRDLGLLIRKNLPREAPRAVPRRARRGNALGRWEAIRI